MAKKAIKTPVFKLSMTSISRYMQCPKLWHFIYKENLSPRTDYPRLCGVEVHRFIAGLYKKHSDDRPFWYKSVNSARKAWFVTWKKALEENRSKIIIPDKEMEKKYAGIGAICIQNYWNQNFEKPHPISIEKHYSAPLYYPELTGVTLTGVFDQVRTVSLPWLRKRRPEIFKGDEILPEYDPVLIVDLKTGWSDYTISENDSEFQKVKTQFGMQFGSQGSAYAYLYKISTGKYPAGFLLYYLRDEKDNTYLVKGDEEGPQLVFKDTVFHIVENIRNESFPRNVTSLCKRCDYYMECRPDGVMSVSLPDAIPESIPLSQDKKEDEPVQLKLPFKKGNKK